jgi:hypothetical protein
MKTVRIGGASAFYTDSILAVAQLLKADPCPDYLMFDFMSEGTMGMMARARNSNQRGGGYVEDIITYHIAPNLDEIVAKKVKLIANAGGMNPRGCAEAIEAYLKSRGVTLQVGYVQGDDIGSRLNALRAAGTKEMFSGEAFPEQVESINVYLGAFPIAQALSEGADIVITGRCADSSLGLGPLIHEFGWKVDDWDRLAAGTLVGHLLECGCQATGGTFTDWEDVTGPEDVGFPIAEVREDGSCVITKPEGTGGLVTPGTVAEQILYEVSDPQAYIVADVVCDFSQVKLEQIGKDRVSVSGARGYPATDTYKGVAGSDGGFRGTFTQVILGIDAARKAERQGKALIERARRILEIHKLRDYHRTDVDVIGAEWSYGPKSTAREAREVWMRASVNHTERRAAELFLRECYGSTTAGVPGSSATLSVAITQLSKIFLFLTPKRDIPITVTVAGQRKPFLMFSGTPFDPASLVRPVVEPCDSKEDEDRIEVPLVKLAWGRSGDKGNLFNVGAIARRPEYLPYIRAALTEERVGECYAHLYPKGVRPRVTLYEVPGFYAINCVVHDSMDGGILMTAHVDNAAKGMAQQLLQIPIRVPKSLLRPDRRTSPITARSAAHTEAT